MWKTVYPIFLLILSLPIQATNDSLKLSWGGGSNLILPHSGSQKRQNWDEVKWGKLI